MALNVKRFGQFFLAALFCLYPAALPAVTPAVPAQPSQHVVDLAGVLTPEARVLLNASLEDLEARTTAQVVVLTLNSLEGEPIEEFSHQTAVKWRIGQKGKDNGVLLTVAVKDHKYRIEVGYGLESVLPDSLVGSLGRQYLVPNFRKGDFVGGIVAVVAQISKIIAGPEAGGQAEKASAPPAAAAAPAKSASPLTPFLVFIFIFLIVLHLITRNFRRRGGFIWFGDGSGGGWSSGGDSGGFSGGGGDFGGGGASGDW